MYEEHTTHIELNTHQSRLSTSYWTFLPVDIAYKITENHVFSWYGMFSRWSFRFLPNITAELTSLRLETIMAPRTYTPSITPISNSDYNKTNGHKIRMIQDTNWKSSIHCLFQMVTVWVPFHHTEYNGIRNVIMYYLTVWRHKISYDDIT